MTDMVMVPLSPYIRNKEGRGTLKPNLLEFFVFNSNCITIHFNQVYVSENCQKKGKMIQDTYTSEVECNFPIKPQKIEI